MRSKALIGSSVNLEIVKPTFEGEGAKMVINHIPFVAAGTSANVGRALTQNSIDTKVIALVGGNLESQLLVEKLRHELYLDVLDCQVLSDVNLTVATESTQGTRYVCAKPSFIQDKEIIAAAALILAILYSTNFKQLSPFSMNLHSM